ncbi:MAG: M1 family metallopeptidase [Gemmatimonadaceae bacterium]
MKHAPFAFLALLAAAGCVRQPQQPVVLSPVRVDSAGTIAATAPTAGTAGGAAAGTAVRTTSDDPFTTTNRMDWPGPNAFRSSTGAPGPDYWQQRADYTIAATLDTTAQTVSGTVTVRYTNNSPDTLRFVWLQLDQNLYRPGSKGSAVFPADSRWGVRGFAGGYELASVTVNGRPAAPKIDDTMMRLDVPGAPIAPKGGKATIAIRYSFRVPEHGSDRMGRDGTLYEIAQWYPRMAVYDDVRGWNTDPYLGQGEFYLEYGDIDYAITAPAGYVIAGSGVLQNPADVLTPAQRERLARAAKSTSVVQIVPQAEARATPTPGTKTWRFRAQNVRDVAWAGAPDFRWDATSWNGVLTQAYYQWPKAGPEWETMAEGTQWTIRTYSELWFPFPYPQATAVAGPVGGMEYPMFVMDHYTDADSPGEVFRTNDHEHGHEWFPMIVGSNERRYAWQDEGFNTYINAFSQERRYGADPAKWPQGMDNFQKYVANWRAVRQRSLDVPLMTAPDRVPAPALGAIGYRKPGAVLLTLRDEVVGRETFDRAFREYVRRWAFKHPTPADFFRTVENVSGQDLSWFWRSFFYTTDVLDIGIADVRTRDQRDGDHEAVISLRRNSSVPFPVSLRLGFADGTTQDVRLPVDIWASGNEFDAVVSVKGQVTGARLWPSGFAPDFNAQNDSWGTPPAADPVTPATAGGLTTPVGTAAAAVP